MNEKKNVKKKFCDIIDQVRIFNIHNSWTIWKYRVIKDLFVPFLYTKNTSIGRYYCATKGHNCTCDIYKILLELSIQVTRSTVIKFDKFQSNQ